MAQLSLDLRDRRMLLADWFGHLAVEAGLALPQYGTSGNAYTIGAPPSFHIRAAFIDEEPYLRFEGSDSGRDEVISAIAAKAAARVAAGDLGGEVWYTTELHEIPWGMDSPQYMSTLLQRLGNQTRILGWRRLGGGVLLDFAEKAVDGADGQANLLAPTAVVKVYIAVPGPKPGHFASRVAHSALEVVGSICTFALGRPVALPHVVFPAEPGQWEPAAANRADMSVLTLARKNVPLDIMGWAGRPGGFPVFERLRSALLTFDAAARQEHDAVASILYVVAAECLTTPATTWRTAKLTKRFREFYDELMPIALDQIVGHGNFEEAFGIRRGARKPRKLRQMTLDRMYSFRSGQLHEGLAPSYAGFLSDPVAGVRRGLYSDFAESAILGYILAPRSSLIGHPMYDDCDIARSDDSVAL